MKIGIFTFHSQINYGGVLQAYALQKTLESMGHEVYVIDRWLDEKNCTLHGVFSEYSFPQKCRKLLYAMIGNGEASDFWRRYRTSRFIKENLNITPYHFFQFSEAPAALSDFDCYVVGSDQVWNFNWPDNQFYLLHNAPSSVPRIAYAASMGDPYSIKSDNESEIKQSLKKFIAISVREKSAQKRINQLGLAAEHVVDPTLLSSSHIWEKFVKKNNNERRLFCYFMEYKLNDIYSVINKYAKRAGVHVDIFLNNKSQYSVGFSKRYGYYKEWVKLHENIFNPYIHLHFSADPTEFVRYASMATDCVTDSFHALMFSIIFQLNEKVLSPDNEMRINMFSRIKESLEFIHNDNVISPSLSEALDSFLNNYRTSYNFDMIENKREFSKKWLEESLQAAYK